MVHRYTSEHQVPIDRSRPFARDCLDCQTRPLEAPQHSLLQQGVFFCVNCERQLCPECGQPALGRGKTGKPSYACQGRPNVCVMCRAKERGAQPNNKSVLGLCAFDGCEMYVGPYITKSYCELHKKKREYNKTQPRPAPPARPASIREIRAQLCDAEAQAQQARDEMDALLNRLGVDDLDLGD